MKLCIVTQIVDREDPVLGFFHGWIAALAPQYESIEVLCLQEGVHALPGNVRVHSLGKVREEETTFRARIMYTFRFWRILLGLRGTYDAVLVHMNQEYVLLAGWYWRLMRIPIYLWRNHYSGSTLTDIAAFFCRKIFCTSRYSYTAKYRKTVRMPVGTDAQAREGGVHTPGTILSLGRISPSKNIHVIIEAFALLEKRGVAFTATIRGKVSPEDSAYAQGLRDSVAHHHLEDRVTFGDAVPKQETYREYQAHEIFVNASPSGMLDKTIFSAMMNGCIVLASSGDYRDMVDTRFTFEEGNAHSLAEALSGILTASDDERRALATSLHHVAKKHSLGALIDALTREIV